jgi:hypothetical protein
MKKTFYPFLLAGLILGCQQQKPATTVAAAAPPAAPSDSTSKPTPKAETSLPTLFAAADTLTQPMRDLLQTHDLSALWRNNDGADRDKPAFEGFFGPDHYHFAMAFTKVTRDPANPAVYHVAGKCRYRKNIRPFSGTLTVRQIANLAYPGFLQAKAIQEERAADSVAGRTYTARAQLQLREEQKENSGIFEGEILLDFYTVPGQRPNFVTVYDHEGINERFPTRGSGLLLRGKRLNATTGQVKSFTVAPWVATVAPDVFKDFMLDERMGEINPKYAKLGWNEYWNNDEWWADSPKPKLSL